MKYILVTGASGGMGKAAVNALAKKGYTVFALDRVLCDGGRNIIPVQADITDENSVAEAVGMVRRTTEELFAIVHFAGIYMLDSLAEIDSADFKKIFDVNLVGAFLINKAFVPFLRSGSRIIITTSELAALDPLPFTGIYAVSKSTLDRYAYSLRMELQLLGIYVSVIRAGAVRTGMLNASTAALDSFCRTTKLYGCNAKRFRRIVDSVETKCVPPERIAEKMLSILEKRSPAFAYGINRNFLLRLYGIMPTRLQLFAIKCVLQ